MVANTAYILTGCKIKYLYPILNSKIVSYYFSNFVSVNLGTKACRWLNQYVENIPVPMPDLVTEKCFINITDRINQEDNNSPFFEPYSIIIDLMIYRLYELKYTDIKLIDPNIDSVLSELKLTPELYENMSIEELAKLSQN